MSYSSFTDEVLPFDDGFLATDSFSNYDSAPADQSYFSPEIEDVPILPPPEEIEPQEGLAIREWKRQNAIRLEEKERREKELLSQIIDEAEEYKIGFHRKGQVTCETNRSTNREKEKVFVASEEKFHAEADKDYWKSIAELIPKEVPRIENRKGKKEDEEKKPSVVVVQGPKPGKPTDLSRMRQLLVKLKLNTPPHLQPSQSTATDAKAPEAPAVAVA